MGELRSPVSAPLGPRLAAGCWVHLPGEWSLSFIGKFRGRWGAEALVLRLQQLAVARVWDRQFLGYSFWVAAGKVVKRRVSKKALTKFKERVRQITSRSGGRSLQQVAEELRRYVLGWKAYFGLADTPGVFRDLDQWIHRRLRTQLRQWKRGRTAYRELRARGVSENLAWRAARFARSWWHVAAHHALHTALPGAYFDELLR